MNITTVAKVNPMYNCLGLSCMACIDKYITKELIINETRLWYGEPSKNAGTISIAISDINNAL